MFRSALVKLTAAYLGILMIISLGFSAAVYQVSVNALDESLRLQIEAIERQPRFRLLPPSVNLERIREEQLEQGQQRIVFNLLLVNIVVMVIGGAGSYWLAGRTLRPIEEALEAQRRFTADASHELRTPLTAMKTEIEVALRDKKLKLPEAKKLLSSNLEEIDGLRGLADSLLTLSRYQSGEHISLASVDMRVVAEEAVERLQPVIQDAKAEVTVVGGSVRLQAERDSLVAVVKILIDNALKYRQSKLSPKVVIEVAKRGRRVELRVTDNGMGIAKEDQGRVFDRFYRTDSSRSKQTEGHGLGLAIARQVVQMHHGSIRVESKLRQGTTVVVNLPLSA